jgi:hypothetical protein
MALNWSMKYWTESVSPFVPGAGVHNFDTEGAEETEDAVGRLPFEE